MVRTIIISLFLVVLLAACQQESTAPEEQPQAPKPPTNVTATLDTVALVVLQWNDDSDNEDGFRIERKYELTGDFVRTGTVAANTTMWRDSTVFPGTNFHYRVWAFNMYGSAFEDTAQIRTPVSIVESVGKDYQDPANRAEYLRLLYGFSPYSNDIVTPELPISQNLEISYGSPSQVWYYFWIPGTGDLNNPVWQFGTVTATDLSSLTVDSLANATFYAAGDTALTIVFGFDFGTTAIRRSVGSILLARHVNYPEIVFALSLSQVAYPYMTVSYVVVNLN